MAEGRPSPCYCTDENRTGGNSRCADGARGRRPPSSCTNENHRVLKRMDCNSHNTDTPSSTKRALCSCITIFLLLAGVTVLVLWLVYRPYKPRFTVVGAAIYGLNATSPLLMSTTMQFTILIRNPNKRVSIYYDRISAFVSYRNQAITQRIMLQPFYLGKHSTVSLSPLIGCSPVPVSIEVSSGLEVDETYGVVGLRLVLLGRLRWKAGAIRTAHYGFYVECDLLMGLKKGFAGQVPLLGAPGCNVHT